ncbi:MAG: hypothetical protein Tsb0013_19330 [Phycisphaerales bacterium]
MDTPRVIRPIRPLREVHPVRNAIVFALLALVIAGVAIVWWDNKEAARSITEAVHAWRTNAPATGDGTTSPGLPAHAMHDTPLRP